MPVAASRVLRLVRVVGVQHALRADDAQAEVALEAHHVAHRELGDVAHPGDVDARPPWRPSRARLLHAADLAQRVQPHEVLADRRVVTALPAARERGSISIFEVSRNAAAATGRAALAGCRTKSPARVPS